VIKEGQRRREKRKSRAIEDAREHRHEINSGSIEWGGRGSGSGHAPFLLLTSPPLSSVRRLRRLRRLGHMCVTRLLLLRCLCLLNICCLCLHVLLGMSYLRFMSYLGFI
jgi:hypothetical protein